jgi:hypothetical protein
MTKAEMLERAKFVETLYEYANDKQLKTLQEVVKQDGNVKRAARVLGVPESTIRSMMKRLSYLSAKCQNPVTAVTANETPAGFSIDRISKHIDKDGVISGWVIANRDKQNQFEAMKSAWEDVCVSLPKAELVPAPEHVMENILCDYTIGDNHTGLYAWAEEAGDDWDLEKSVDILHKAMNHLVYHAPAAKIAYILDVGDFYHADNSSNETSSHGNKLDVDGRYANVLSAGVECICSMITLALQKHETVLYRSVIGNHNEHSAVMMNLAVKMRFHNEERLVVLDSPSHHHYYQFGCNLLADTHGHTTKADNLPLLMAVDQPKMWAETTNRVWRTGHIHHLSQKEYSGCTVISYRTLAPKDAWHAASGYRSNRDMRCTTYHKDRGTVGVQIVNPSMLGY